MSEWKTIPIAEAHLHPNPFRSTKKRLPNWAIGAILAGSVVPPAVFAGIMLVANR